MFLAILIISGILMITNLSKACSLPLIIWFLALPSYHHIFMDVVSEIESDPNNMDDEFRHITFPHR